MRPEWLKSVEIQSKAAENGPPKGQKMRSLKDLKKETARVENFEHHQQPLASGADVHPFQILTHHEAKRRDCDLDPAVQLRRQVVEVHL